jgi:hypothetical protein
MFKLNRENVWKSARQTMALTASPQAPHIKNEVAEKLAKVGLGEDTPDEELLYLLQELIDPKQRGEAKGPTGASLSADVNPFLISTGNNRSETLLTYFPSKCYHAHNTL